MPNGMTEIRIKDRRVKKTSSLGERKRKSVHVKDNVCIIYI